MKRQSKKNMTKSSSKDSLVTKAEEKGDIELREEELKNVSGGMLACVKIN